MIRALLVALACAACVAGQSGPREVSPEVFAQARIASGDIYNDLKSFVCDERVDRFRGGLSGSGRLIDTLSARVSFENGMERYLNVRQDDRPLASFGSVSGAWSEGEFGTLFRQTEQLLSVMDPKVEVTAEPGDGTDTALSFDVPAQESPWELVIAGSHLRIGFHTTVYISKVSGRIVRVERTSTGMPPEFGISRLEWDVNLRPMQLRGVTWLVPQSGRYQVEYANRHRREWNDIEFTNFRRYGSEVAISFDAETRPARP